MSFHTAGSLLPFSFHNTHTHHVAATFFLPLQTFVLLQDRTNPWCKGHGRCSEYSPKIYSSRYLSNLSLQPIICWDRSSSHLQPHPKKTLKIGGDVLTSWPNLAPRFCFQNWVLTRFWARHIFNSVSMSAMTLSSPAVSGQRVPSWDMKCWYFES